MLLIRNGLIHTMTEMGSFQGDLLIHNGKIVTVQPHVDADALELERTVDAKGWHICPGLIDAHMHLVEDGGDDGKNIQALCEDALGAGITTQGLWPEKMGTCLVRHGRETAVVRQPMHAIQPEALDDAQLICAMEEATQRDERIACEVNGERMLRRLLKHRQATGASLVLVHVSGCEEMLEEIVASGSEAILGACVLRSGGSGYAMAQKLHQAGVTVALTSDYPATRLHHLPLCAGLCLRAGMSHDAALRAITSNAARVLRVHHVCGCIAPGMRADLSVFDGDPLMLATARVMTVSGGTIMHES